MDNLNNPPKNNSLIGKPRTNSGRAPSNDSNKKSEGDLMSATISNDKRQTFIDLIAKFCDKCGTSYTLDNVRIVKDTEFSSIIHFACFNCKSNHIATFFKPMGMSSRAPINTDLTVDEISKFSSLGRVSTEEVLDLYNEFENYQDKKED